VRIAHVVTYVSADGAFGGPVAVAAGQAEELARRGHTVDFLAGWDGEAALEIPGVTVRLFPVTRLAPGLSGLTSRTLLAFLRDQAKEYDAVHIHMGRDLVTLPAATVSLSQGRRVFLQTHGMVMPDTRVRARLMDAVLTRRALSRADVVFVLTDAEAEGVARVGGSAPAPVARIPNGVAIRDLGHDAREDPPVVLFLARLHPRKRVLAFAEMARLLTQQGLTARFRVIGPDEGDLRALLAFKQKHDLESIEYRGAIAAGESIGELAQAAVYVLPSFGEVFPMTVLESFVAQTPVVLSEECAIAPELTSRGAIEPTTGEPSDIARAVGALLSDPSLRARRVASASAALTDWLAIGAVADRLEEAYA
jgi:glycosyltransferase involved in cell wall biosynthesis